MLRIPWKHCVGGFGGGVNPVNSQLILGSQPHHARNTICDFHKNYDFTSWNYYYFR